jgi:hypothetical protein
MPYTTNQLITGSYYAAGIVSREFETVSGGQIADGLGWLNDILAEKRIDNGMVPYETKYSFLANVGQETYWIPNLIQIDTLVFYLGKVRFTLEYTKRNQYFGSPRVESIDSLPFQWYFERKVGGGNLHLYFLPDRNYPLEAHGTFGIAPVLLNQDLLDYTSVFDLGVPKFYGSGTLAPGQLVVSVPIQSGIQVVDLMGTYSNIGALIDYINSGIIPGVNARLNVNDFILYSATEPPTPFYVQTSGFPPNGTNFIGSVQAVQTDLIPFGGAIYYNGYNGDGATLTWPSPSILVVDGYTPVVGNLILVNLVDPTEPSFEIWNGVYVVTNTGSVSEPWQLTRAINYDQPRQISEGDLFKVLNGSFYAGTTFVQTADVADVGVSPIIFSIFNAITFSNFSTIEQSAYEVVNPTGFDQFYITYLRYALADRICTEYCYDTPPRVLKQLSKYESWINKKSKLIDLEMVKKSTLQRRGRYGYAYINLGRGWLAGD